MYHVRSDEYTLFPQHAQRAGKHLLQAGQAIENTHWHARQLVVEHKKEPAAW